MFSDAPQSNSDLGIWSVGAKMLGTTALDNLNT